MITATCPRCNSTLKLKNAGAFRCPKCGAEVRVSADITQGQWWLKQFDEVLGPYSASEVEQYIREFRILGSSSLRHQVETLNRWVEANQIKQFQTAFDEARPKIQPPPVSPRLTADTGVVSEVAQVFRSTFNNSKRRSRSSVWKFVRDFTDPTFKHYVTPTIIWITWWTVLCTAALFFVLFMVGSLAWVFDVQLSESRGPRFNRIEQNTDSSGFVFPQFLGRLSAIPVLGIFQFVASLQMLLWSRVILELCIVVFHISETLKSIHLHISPKSSSGKP